MIDRSKSEMPQATDAAFRALVESITEYAIMVLDSGGYVRTWNAGLLRLIGYEADEIVGRHFSVFYTPEDLAAGRHDLELHVAREKGRYEDEGWRVRKDGTRFFANVVVSPIRDADGVVTGYAKVTRDETERRRAEEALRQSEERFRLLVASVRDYAIFMLDPAGHVASWNAGAERIKSYAAHEIIGKHFSQFYPREDIEAGKPEMELRVATAEGRFEDEGWRLRKDGTRFWANVVLTALRDKTGKLIGFAKVTRDLTSRKQAEEARIALAAEQAAREEAEARARERGELVRQLEQANAKLEEAVRARDDFLMVASHELRTPLYTLSMQLSSGLHLSRDVAIPERLRARLQGAQTSVGRLTRLISSLLDVSRIAAGRLLLEPEELDLVAFARDLVAREAIEIQSSGSTVTLHCPETLVGYWDRLRLDQIVTNLLTNALKYGNRQPVELTLESAGDRTRIVVRDRGIGIDAKDHDRIFKRFERAVSNRAYSGFGVGLWIVREITTAMGGTVRFESEAEKGSTFTVEVPTRAAGGARA